MTSPPEPITVECPNCLLNFEDWWRPSVNLDLDDFDDAYLESCTSAICPRCNTKIRLPFLRVEDGTFIYQSPMENEQRRQTADCGGPKKSNRK